MFGDYRESQDAVASQDFGAFFNDAFPLPELGSPEHNFNEVAPCPLKKDLMSQVEAVQDGKEEAVSTDDTDDTDDTTKIMSCSKIWFVDSAQPAESSSHILYRDKVQSMEKFQNGEFDIDSLCEDLKAKARCTEGGGGMYLKDIESILNSAR